VLGETYRFKQRLCYLLLKKHRTRENCVHLPTGFSSLVRRSLPGPSRLP
jgi:hypothetical protein